MDIGPQSYKLNRESIDIISEYVAKCCEDAGVERRQAIKYRLSAEESMLRWLEYFEESDRETGEGPDHTVRASYNKRLNKKELVIEVSGSAFDPYSREARENYGSYGNHLLVEMGLAPDYSYNKDKNVLTFRLKKKPGGMMKTLLMVMLASIVTGFAGKFLLPAHVIEVVTENVINTLYDTFLKILGCVAGPMIFLSVAWGVYGIGDTVTLGRIGKRMMLSYLGATFAAAVLGAPLVLVFTGNFSGSAGNISGFGGVVELLLGIFPSNIIEPFYEGNSLQIIFIAMIIGIALLYLGKRTSLVARAVEQINCLVQFLMEIISRLVPYFIFIVLVDMIWKDTFGIIATVWKPILVALCAFLVIALAAIIFTGVRFKVSPALLVKKNIPAFLVALTTASSAASFGICKDICDRKLGVDDSMSSFGLPLGMIMFKPFTALYFLLVSFFFASEYGVECSVGWVLIAVIVSAVIAVATPPIPGGAAAAYTILFTQLGLPSSAVAVALAIDIIMDFMLTAGDTLLKQLMIVHISSRVGMLNRKILTRSE